MDVCFFMGYMWGCKGCIEVMPTDVGVFIVATLVVLTGALVYKVLSKWR